MCFGIPANISEGWRRGCPACRTIADGRPCRINGYGGDFNPEEVSEVFTVPVSFFVNTSPKIYEVDWIPSFPEDFPFEKIYGGRDYGWRPRKSKIRFYEYEGRVIWGMTARIIENYVMGGGII
jgi:hypothetical protein